MSIARMSVVNNGDRKFTVIVDAYNGLSYQGVMYHSNLSKGLCFDSMVEMIINMDGFMDEIGCPKQSFQMRSFPGTKSKTFVKRFCDEIEREGKLATFDIYIEYRNHASWQGTILWKNGNRKETFNSELQMVLLMNKMLSGDLEGEQSFEKPDFCRLEICRYNTGCIVGKYHNIAAKKEEVFSAPVDFAKTFSDFMETGLTVEQESNIGVESCLDSLIDGKKCTFSIKILFREQSTWQGIIYWHENKVQQPFRSFKELLFMIDSAVGYAEPENVEKVIQ